MAVVAAAARAENWPQWRGPQGDGLSGEKDLPIAWSEKSALRWKCPLPEWGDSTPAIWGDAVFLTSHVDDQKLVLLRINKQSGQIEWTQQVGTASTPRAAALHKSGEDRRQQKFHRSHNLATPSPATDGEVVAVHFGNGDLAAYGFDGKQLWQRNLQTDHGAYTIWWGHANSPVLCGELVISVCMQDSCADLPGEPAPSYVVAHHKRTGALKWKQPRPTAATQESCDSYATPILWRNRDRQEMLVWGGQTLDAYDPATGRRLWELPGLTGNRVIPSPVTGHGMVYVVQGMRQPLLAVRPGGDGRRGRDDIVWKFDQGTSDSPSPVCVGEQLFMVNNDGIVRCFDAPSGRIVWKERLKGEYRASPVAAEGRLYFLNTKGLATVISASRRFDRLTENQLDDETIASPAISDGKLFIRGQKNLYCLAK
jgi:outer membrane protein assembly factor BamB